MFGYPEVESEIVKDYPRAGAGVFLCGRYSVLDSDSQTIIQVLHDGRKSTLTCFVSFSAVKTANPLSSR